MKNNDALKKHHFWIVAGLVPLFVLIAVVLMMSGVGGAITAEAAVIKQAQTDAAGARPPGTGVLKEMDTQKDVLGKKKTELWAANWNVQEPFFSWPKSPAGEFDKYAKLKFGEKLKETSNEFEVFMQPNVYQKSYAELPATIAPTGFRGGWQSVLRYVPDWGVKNPRSEQIWLALEDLWVQRAVLDPVRAVNETLAAFTPVEGDGLKKKFRSRVWDLSLEVADRTGGGGKVFKGKLKNRTPRLQVVGVGNTMRFNVWLDKTPGVAPVLLKIQGDSVEGELEVEFAEQDVPNGVFPVELVKVQQILDERTVPIRRVDQIRIGYLASKGATTELKPPAFWPPDADVAATAAPGAAGGAPVSGAAGPGSEGGRGGPGTGMGGTTAAAAGGPEGVLDANKKRYLETTDQIRRLPVAIHLVVDQAYVQDVLIAYANSPFRFLTVQSHWQRYRGPSPSAATGPGPGSGPSSGGSVPSAGMPSSGGPSIPPSGGGPGYTDDSGINGSLGEGLGGAATSGGGPGTPGGPGLSTAAVSEAQANAGLVDLAIYGVVSLYEKVPEPKPEDKPADEKPADDKKPDDKKPDAVKPADDKKPDDKKPDAVKPADDKKPDDKKPDAVKPADDKKPDDKKPDAVKPADEKKLDDKKPEAPAGDKKPDPAAPEKPAAPAAPNPKP